jgi:two-component sensor histidine kinase
MLRQTRNGLAQGDGMPNKHPKASSRKKVSRSSKVLPQQNRRRASSPSNGDSPRTLKKFPSRQTEAALLKALKRTTSGSTEDFFRSLVADLTAILRTFSALVDESAASVLAAFAARADHELELLRTHKTREDQLRRSLAEKENLLKEVHHRVKNNLQVITSLLNLQAASIQNPEMLTLLQESQNRVRSMALVHDKLHHSTTHVSLDFAEYIRTMAAQLMRSYGKGGVAVSLNVEPIQLGIDAAIPCGLLLNELISNAVRHAFPEGRNGIINIGLTRTHDNKVMLRVADDGIGLPAGMDWRHATTMGMMLIVGLSQQLSGTLDVTTSQGSIFTIIFPAE